MSRAASKSRADKGRAPATPAPAPPPAHSQDVVDIIPGRLTQSFWMSMVAQEEGEEIVRDILDDLLTHVMEKCKEVYLKQQLIPFTVSRARDTLLEILEWRFMVQDVGDSQQSDSTWKEDSEPQPLLTDSWAQGCVSVTQRKPTPPPQMDTNWLGLSHTLFQPSSMVFGEHRKPRTPVKSQQARRRSKHTTTDEVQQRALGVGKEQKDPKACREIKQGPDLAASTDPGKKSLPPPAITFDTSEKNSLGPGNLFLPGQTSGSPQPTRRPNNQSFTNSVPHHIDLSPGVEVSGPCDSYLSALREHHPQPQQAEFRLNRGNSPPSLKFLNELLAGTSS